MRSPVASHKQMQRINLEDGLVAFQCSESGGVFLPVESYFRWLSSHSGRLPHLPVHKGDVEVALEDSKGVKICPESGQIMQRFHVGHGFSFYLDRSPSGSVWLDKGEWESLKGRNFHDELHLIFTAPWQERVRTEEKQEAQRCMLKDRLGLDLYSRLEALREELSELDSRDLALAYLQN